MNLKGENLKRDIKTARLWLGKSAEHRKQIASEILENMDNYSQKDIKIFAIRKSFIVSMSIQALRKSMKNEVERQKNIQEHERMITKNSDEIDQGSDMTPNQFLYNFQKSNTFLLTI